MPDLGFMELFTRQVVSLITPPGTLRRYPGALSGTATGSRAVGVPRPRRAREHGTAQPESAARVRRQPGRGHPVRARRMAGLARFSRFPGASQIQLGGSEAAPGTPGLTGGMR